MNSYRVAVEQTNSYSIDIMASSREQAGRDGLTLVRDGEACIESTHTYVDKIFQLTGKDNNQSYWLTEYLANNYESFLDLDKDTFVINPTKLQKVLDDYLSKVI